MTKYWLGVVSKEHVMRGVAGNYVQVCHGKAAPLRRMQEGDWFIYYSPVNAFMSKEKLQAFTAIGRVSGNETYQVEMFEGFKPFRRDVTFVKEYTEVPLANLKSELTFTQGNYGMAFRRGHLEISRDDFEKIARAMGVETTQVLASGSVNQPATLFNRRPISAQGSSAQKKARA